ncbi:MAG: DUF2971 domain-containing protein [Anaerolineales bacterium]
MNTQAKKKIVENRFAMPDKLYHYTKASIALVKILPTGKIRAGSLGRTNDPRETKDWSFPVFATIANTGESETLRSLQNAHQANNEANRIRKEEWFFLSFSKEDKQKPSGSFADSFNYQPAVASPRLWAHYGENHMGICFEFDGPKLLERVKQYVKDLGDVFIAMSSMDMSMIQSGKTSLMHFSLIMIRYLNPIYKMDYGSSYKQITENISF